MTENTGARLYKLLKKLLGNHNGLSPLDARKMAAAGVLFYRLIEMGFSTRIPFYIDVLLFPHLMHLLV